MKKKNKKQAFSTFSEYYEYNKLKKEISVTGLFLCLLSTVLAVYFYIQAVASVGLREVVYDALALFFALVLIAYVLFPVALFSLLHKLRPITDFVGKYALRVILLPVYLLLCLFSLPFLRRFRKKYRFEAWEEAEAPADSYFTDDTQNGFGAGSSGTFHFLSTLLRGVAKNRQYFLFPILILLLLIGLLFYFISTSTLLGFIYTIF